MLGHLDQDSLQVVDQVLCEVNKHALLLLQVSQVERSIEQNQLGELDSGDVLVNRY